MLDELIKSAKEQVAERLASPILGSFLISWCLWNYKFLVILFSAATVTKTFELINTVAFPSTRITVLYGLVLPALTATAYIFIYPYPAKFVYGFTRRRQKEIAELRRKIEDETPLTIEESRKLRTDALQSEYRHKEELDRLNAELTRTKEQLEKLASTSLPSAKEVPPPIQITLESSQVELMKNLEKIGGKATQSHVLSISGLPKVKTEYDLGELERLKLLHKDYSQIQKDYTYEFTHDGRRVVLEANKP